MDQHQGFVLGYTTALRDQFYSSTIATTDDTRLYMAHKAFDRLLGDGPLYRQAKEFHD